MQSQRKPLTGQCRCSGIRNAVHRAGRMNCSHLAAMNARESNGQQQQQQHHSTADALDALLGTQDEQQQHPDSQLVPWWQIKPKQSAPPRQKLMHPPGDVARFVPEQALYASKVRSGKSTAVGGELDLPQAEPYFCYLVMAMQLAVYAAGTWLAVAQGPESAEQWALTLAMQPEAAIEQGELWRLGTCLVLHGGLTHLALDTFFLGWMGPGIEALLGHSVFMYVYLFSGLTGSAAVTLLSDPSTPVAGATAATVGLVGAMVGYELRNVEVVKQSLKSRLSKAEDGKHGSSTLRKPWGAFGIVCLVLLLGGVPNSMMDNAAHAAGLLAGLGLGYFMGPSFTVVQEIDIPEGSMSVPDEAEETVVVLDRRSTLDRLLAGAASLGALSGVLVLGSAVKHATGI